MEIVTYRVLDVLYVCVQARAAVSSSYDLRLGPVRVSAAALDSATQNVLPTCATPFACLTIKPRTGPLERIVRSAMCTHQKTFVLLLWSLQGLPRLCICKSVHASGRCAAAS